MQFKIMIMSTLIVSITSDLENDCKKWSDFAKSLSESYEIRFKNQNTKYKKLEKMYNDRFDLSCQNRSAQQVKLPCTKHEKRWQNKINELITDRNKQFSTIDKLDKKFRNCLKNLEKLDFDLEASFDKYNKYETISLEKDLRIIKLEQEIEKSSRDREYVEKNGLYTCLTAKKEGDTILSAKKSEIEKLTSRYSKLLEKINDLETDLKKVRIETETKSDEFLKLSKHVSSVNDQLETAYSSINDSEKKLKLTNQDLSLCINRSSKVNRTLKNCEARVVKLSENTETILSLQIKIKDTETKTTDLEENISKKSAKMESDSDKIADLEKLKVSLEKQLDAQRETHVEILFNHRMFILGVVFLLVISLMLNFGLCCFKKNHKHSVPASENIPKLGFLDSRMKCDLSKETLLNTSIDRSDTDGSQTAV